MTTYRGTLIVVTRDKQGKVHHWKEDPKHRGVVNYPKDQKIVRVFLWYGVNTTATQKGKFVQFQDIKNTVVRNGQRRGYGSKDDTTWSPDNPPQTKTDGNSHMDDSPGQPYPVNNDGVQVGGGVVTWIGGNRGTYVAGTSQGYKHRSDYGWTQEHKFQTYVVDEGTGEPYGYWTWGYTVVETADGPVITGIPPVWHPGKDPSVWPKKPSTE